MSKCTLYRGFTVDPFVEKGVPDGDNWTHTAGAKEHEAGRPLEVMALGVLE